MSEELLNALMQLFTIIAKQNNEPSFKVDGYVSSFLSHQLDSATADKYFNLFRENSIKKNNEKRVSVMDSVSTIGIAKKINKILTQKQKIVVLIRVFELIKADETGFDLKYAIIKTLAEVFNISSFDFKLVEAFILTNSIQEIEKSELLIIDGNNNLLKVSEANIDLTNQQQRAGLIYFLRIHSVNLILFKTSERVDVKWNGNAIHPDSVYVLATGGVIQINSVKPIYYQEILSCYTRENSFLPLSFNVNNVQYKFSNGNLGLQDICISEGPGKLIGIMGASGSGKTTLLNVISSLQKPSAGEVLLNGINIHLENRKVKGAIGFVPQDDLLVEELTVYQNLFFNAQFCFSNLSKQEIEDKALDLLDSLALAEVRNSKVGSVLNKVISGGQRKRLNIALELIREPSVLFLDEPTSGLSSKDSENIIKLLNQLSLKGKLIFVVIHQPNSDIYKLFDKVLLLDKGGYMIYNGNPVEAVSYFKTMDKRINNEFGECPACGNINSETIFDIIESETVNEFGAYTGTRKVAPKEWLNLFKSKFNIPKKEEVTQAPPNSLHTPTRIKQLFIYLKRDFLAKFTNKQYIIINLLEIPLLAFLLAFIIRYISNPENDVYVFRENENIPAYLFMTIIVFSFMGISVSAEEIFKDNKILKRENFLNLSRTSYLFSKIFLLFSLSAIQSALFVLIGNAIIGIHDMFFSYWLMLFTVSCCANIIGLNISSAFNSVVTIYILIPLLLIPQMILGGAMFDFEKLNKYIGGGYQVPYIAEFIPARWAYEGLMVNQFKNNPYEKIFFEMEKNESIYNYKRGPYIAQLTKIIDEASRNNDSSKTQVVVGYDRIDLLRNELSKEMALNPKINFGTIKFLKTGLINKTVIDSTRQYLDQLNTLYSLSLNMQTLQKEVILHKLQDNANKTKEFRQFKDAYYNEHLADVVQKTYSSKKLIEYNQEITQIIDPIYNDPKPGFFLNFRTHFYSPTKIFCGKYIDTFIFNTIILWIFILVLYLILYFNLVKKIINFRSQNENA
jgi:ABC transport system ATP-binding/permease protein